MEGTEELFPKELFNSIAVPRFEKYHDSSAPWMYQIFSGQKSNVVLRSMRIFMVSG